VALGSSRSQARRGVDIWPGFVDALSSLLLVIIFLLVVFVLSQVVLNEALSGRDEALKRLNQQVAELGDLLALEREANADLRLNVAQLAVSLQTSTQERDNLKVQLRLEADRAREVGKALTDANAAAQVDRDALQVQLATLESLRRDIATLKDLRARLEGQVSQLAAALAAAEERSTTAEERTAALESEVGRLVLLVENREEAIVALTEQANATTLDRDALDRALAEARIVVGQLRDRSMELEAKLAEENERTTLAQKELAERDIRLSELVALQQGTAAALDEERTLTTAAQAQVALLNQQILALRDQLARVEAALDAAEVKDREQGAVIADLGKRLNLALAQKVEELQRYRSEFFGRLREALGERRDISIVGDRFVFQSEVLFESAAADVGEAGKSNLAALAQTLLEVAATIPPELPWILRVDGHTDPRPINNVVFASNWELSSARATSVVKYLIEQGIPPARLAATGFGEFQPLDPGHDEIANRRNRRIEIKLTER